MNIEKQSVLSYTGQTWKYHAGNISGSLSAIILISAFVLFSTGDHLFYYFVISAGIVALTSLVIEFSIKCPKCKSRWYLDALKKSVGSGAITKIRTKKACPRCGFTNDNIT